MSPLQLLAPTAHTCLLLSWDLTSGDDLRRGRTDLYRFFAAAGSAAEQAGLHDVVQRMALVVTELAGNALRHGLPPVVVRLMRDDDCFILDVSDHDPHHAPELVEAQNQSRAGGRGLRLARALAQQLCWYRDENTKHVWASFPRRPATEADVVPAC